MLRARAVLPLLLLAACSGAPPRQASSGAAPTAAPTPDPARPLPLPLPDVVARVNGSAILIKQILPIAKSTLDRWQGAEREQHTPEALRGALDRFIDRELLLQEALARGIKADTRQVEWSYDQARAEHKDDDEWTAYLVVRGTDPQTFRAELRAQHTVAALLADEARTVAVSEQELRAAYDADPMAFAAQGAVTAPAFDDVRSAVDSAVRRSKMELVQESLLRTLRARARIETYL
jgi:SurA-like protein